MSIHFFLHVSAVRFDLLTLFTLRVIDSQMLFFVSCVIKPPSLVNKVSLLLCTSSRSTFISSCTQFAAFTFFDIIVACYGPANTEKWFLFT